MAQNPLDNFADAVMQGVQRRTRQGRIGRKEVDGSRTIEVPTRPHFVYVRAGVTDATGEVLEAYNGGAPHKFGTPVLMIRWNRTWRIIGIDIDSPSMDKDTYSVAYHVHSVRAGLPQSFLDLLGMPNTFGTPGQVLKVNDVGDNLYFGDPGSGGGSPNFLGLTDTPDDYTGQGGKYVKVNGPEDALIFGVLPTGFSGAYGDLTGVPSTFAPSAHHVSHEVGGTDHVSVAYSDLSSIPSTFAPSAHAASHKNGGSDEVATATPGANAIPKANASGNLVIGWIADSAITYAKIQNVSANKVLGSVAGGVVSEIAMTAFGRTLAALADAAAGIAALGLDAIYGRLAIANTWTANNVFNSTATSGNALSVTRNLTAASTDAAVVSVLQNHPSDDQPALLVSQDGQGAAIGVRGPNAKSSATVSTPLTMYSNDAVASALALLYQINGNATAGSRYTSIHSIEQGTAYRPLVLNPNADVMAVILRAFSAEGLTITDDGGNVAIFVEDGGFVGVGPNATNPTVSLHVRKDQNTSTVVTVENQTDGNIASALFQALNAQGDSMQFGVFPSLHSYGAVAGRDGFMYSSSNVVMMADAAAGVIKFATGGNAEKARIDANGRMGIGTTNPVANSAYSRLTVSATDATAVYETIENLGAGQAALQLTRTGTTPSGWVMYIPGAEDALAFYNSTLNANVIKLLSTGSLLVGVASASAKIALQAGTSTNDAAVGGVLYVDTTQRTNAATVETELGSYTIPANTLSANNMSLRFHIWGTGVNGSTKVIKVYFGATSFTIITSASPAFKWSLYGTIVRTGAATQKIIVDGTGTIQSTVVTTAAETLSGTVILKVTGTALSANDILEEMFKVWFEPENT